MHALRPADEAHRRHAEAAVVEALLRGRNQARIVGKTEVIVGAEVEHLAAFGEPNGRRLRTLNDALALVEAVGANPIENVVRV